MKKNKDLQAVIIQLLFSRRNQPSVLFHHCYEEVQKRKEKKEKKNKATGRQLA
jgi:hypothetical protein